MANYNFLFVLFAFGVSVANAADELTHIVQLKHGGVHGKILKLDNGAKVEFFEGIKYGQAKRFEKPTAVHPWTYVYPATSMRDACPQFGSNQSAIIESPLFNFTKTFSEDCLYLNLWRPAEEKKNRTVLVYIHGGAFEFGSAFIGTHTAGQANLAQTGDVIVVAINYRLGPLGFAYWPGVPANLGLHDQLFALKWVQENIAAFGGNPADVTIFGQSAGSISVGALVLSPLGKGLFHRAILGSGAPTVNTLTEPLSSGMARTQILAKNVNCTLSEVAPKTFDCLKHMDLAELQIASLGDFDLNHFFIPVYGDEVLPNRPSTALERGSFNQVDLLYGVTRDEGTSFIPALIPEIRSNQKLTRESAKSGMKQLLKLYHWENDAREVAEFYMKKVAANATQDKLKIAISNVWGDLNLVCPTILFGEEYARHSTRHTFSYRLIQPFTLPGQPDFWTGVTHGTDGRYLFFPQVAKLTHVTNTLSQDMIHAWLAFAKTGVPTKMGGNVVWEEAANRSTGNFNSRVMYLKAGEYKMVDGAFSENCEKFWKAKLFN